MECQQLYRAGKAVILFPGFFFDSTSCEGEEEVQRFEMRGSTGDKSRRDAEWKGCRFDLSFSLGGRSAIGQAQALSEVQHGAVTIATNVNPLPETSRHSLSDPIRAVS